MPGSTIDRLEIQIETDARKANAQLDALARKLGKVSSSLSAIGKGNINGLANGVTKLANGMKAVNAVKTSDFTRLANNIEKLGKIDTTNLNKVAAALSTIGKSMSTLGNGAASARNVTSTVTSIKQLSNASLGATNNTNTLKNVMRGLSIAGKTMFTPMLNGAKVFSSSLLSITSRITGISKLSSRFNSLRTSMSGAATSSRSLAYAFGKMYANYFLVIRGIKQLRNAIESSMNYIETYNYYNVTMDKIASDNSSRWQEMGYESAEAYANSFSGRLNELTTKMSGYSVDSSGMLQNANINNLSLDPNSIMNYEASIAAITNSVGLMGENSINTSKALTMLSADLSSLKNIDLQTVMTNLQSGLVGQSRALYKYGIDITNATLQTYAYANGVSKVVSEMTQAEKMQLRVIAILDQSKVAWGDMANTINSVANQWRILKQQAANVARTFGALLMPAVQAVLPWVNALTMAFQRLLNFIGNAIFGKKWAGIMDGISGGYSDTLDGLEAVEDSGLGDVSDVASDNADSFNDATKAAEKYKRTILGFDEINKLDSNDTSSTSGNTGSGSGVGSGIGSGSGIDLTDAIADALADYESVWDKALKSSANKAQKYMDKIIAVFNKMYKLIKVKDWDGLGEYVAGGINSVFDSINNTFNWSKLGPNITGFMNALTSTINSLVDNVNFYNIGTTMGNGLNVITNTLYQWYTGIDWENIGVKLAEGANGLIVSIDWDMIGKAIGAKMMVLPDILLGFVETFDFGALGISIADALNGVFEELDLGSIGTTIGLLVSGMFDMFANFASEFNWQTFGTNIANGINNLFENLEPDDISNGINSLVSGIASLIGTVLSETDWEDVFSNMISVWEDLDWETKLAVVCGLLASAFVSVLGTKLMSEIAVSLILDTVKALFSSTATAAVDAGTIVAGTSGNWLTFAITLGKVAGVLGAIKLGLDLGQETMSTEADLESATTYLSNFSVALDDLVAKGKLTEEQQRILNDTIGNLAVSGADPVTTLETLKDKLSECGISADELKQSADDSGTKLDELWVSMRNSESSSATANTSIANTGTAAENAGNNVENLKTKVDEASQSMNVIDLKSACDSIKSVGDTANNVSFVPLSNNAAAAIASIDSTWTNGKGTIQKTARSTFITGIDLKQDLVDKFDEYARNAIEGFNAGINNKKPDLARNLKDVAQNSIIKPLHDELEIGSPSKLTEKYAGWFGDGFVNNLSNAFSPSISYFSNLISEIGKIFSGSSLYNIGSSAIQSLSRGISSIHISLPHISWSWNNFKVGNSSFSLPSFGIDWYANGGFPGAGDLFMANEDGPEMVGRMGSKNAVVNNNQIVESVSSGVKQAVMEAMMSVGGMNNNSDVQSPVIEITIKTDEETLYKAVRKGKEKYNGRYLIDEVM